MSGALMGTRARVAAVAFDEFGYAYSGATAPALTDVSLDVQPGEFVLVCGDSGSGKSTLLRAVSGLVPHHFGGAVSGEASICGRDLRSTDAGQMAAVCGTLFQDPESQSVMDSVRAEIAFPLENFGWPKDQIAIAVEEAAAVLGIGDLLARRTAELSGGELQRVALAAAIASRPPVLVLDEPTSQLDPVAADELLSALQRLAHDHGTTILLADHRIERALEVVDRVLVFDLGRIAIDAEPSEFLELAADDPRHVHMLPPLAQLARLVGASPLPLTMRDARELLPSPAGSFAPQTAAQGEVVLRAERIVADYGALRALAGVDLELRVGERTVLMGANGSGKSTLLRIARGVQKTASGRVTRVGEVALLLQNPNDYLIHERVADEAPAPALERFGLGRFADRDPRDLSGGERQRLALAIVMQDDPAVLLLDEPTRGMDAARKLELAALLREIAARGTAVLVATHDTEFAAQFAVRACLLGAGRLLADANAREVLGGGWHFSTATARLLPASGALTAQEGARLLGGDGS